MRVGYRLAKKFWICAWNLVSLITHWLMRLGGCQGSFELIVPLTSPVKRQSQLQQTTYFVTSFPILDKNKAWYLRNRSAPAVNCWVIIHCLEVSCKEDQITSAQREWFIFVQLTDKQWIITQQFTHWSWSISILTLNKRRKHIRSLQLLPTFRHCNEELPPTLRLRRIRLHVAVTFFKRKNDVTQSNAINDVIFQWRQLSHTFAVNYCPIYHSLLPLAL